MTNKLLNKKTQEREKNGEMRKEGTRRWGDAVKRGWGDEETENQMKRQGDNETFEISECACLPVGRECGIYNHPVRINPTHPQKEHVA